MKRLYNIGYNIGHRGAFLILLGMSYIFYGFSFKYFPIHAKTDLGFSLHTWFWIWMITGTFCVARAFGPSDRFAYGLAALASAAWSTRWLIIWIFSSEDHAWSISALWALITCAILLVSTWQEKGCRPKIERDRE